MITTLKITLLRGRFCEGEWSVNIELDGSATLDDLHYAIQKAVHFDNDHQYCFYLSRTDRSRNREYFNNENELIFTQTIKDLFPLPSKQSLFYFFDWGDDWVFKVSSSRKRPHDPVEGLAYPRVESESGIKPVQYLSDEDDEDEDDDEDDEEDVAVNDSEDNEE